MFGSYLSIPKSIIAQIHRTTVFRRACQELLDSLSAARFDNTLPSPRIEKQTVESTAMAIVVFVALPEEMAYAVAELNKHGEVLNVPDVDAAIKKGHTNFWFQPTFPSPEIRLSLIKGMGNVLSAAHVGAAFSEKGPVDLALLAGISGSLDRDKADIGDVVISDTVKYYAPDKIFNLEGVGQIPLTKDLREAYIAAGTRGTSPLGVIPPGSIGFDDRDVVHGSNVLISARPHNIQ